MPKFELIELHEAQRRTAGEDIDKYLQFLEQLEDGKAGKLEAADGYRVWKCQKSPVNEFTI